MCLEASLAFYLEEVFGVGLIHFLIAINFSPLFYSQESGADDGDEESERSRSEVNDEEDEASGEVVPFYIHSKWH